MSTRPEDDRFETQSGRFADVVEPGEITTTAAAAITATSVAAADAVAAAGDPPTKAEFDAVVALANELKADFNALLTDFTGLRTKFNTFLDQANG